MALLKYFKTTLPTAKETGIGYEGSANAAVSRLTSSQREKRKRKAYTAFSEEQS